MFVSSGKQDHKCLSALCESFSIPLISSNMTSVTPALTGIMSAPA
ncbi:Uncharacterized protein dnm_033350 [Desulfonema magnum]|uniref:Uncharacterized protein n=1 Tax=Desulfonema magnum TaxID=45655 RepID=A0A975BKW8_9BACT|nr:Uncharacterized protein dnm_033350 [Desulfonema magnum]